MFSDTYRTISAPVQYQIREKASKFLAIAQPVQSEEEVKEALQALKKTYYNANHHCYAYQLGPDKSAFRMNDDGEPSGTAGRPIYGQIQSYDLTNILVVVVRYFGGTKLGVSGLISAYKTAAKEALGQADIIEKIVMETYSLHFPYIQLNEVMKTVKERNLGIISTDFNLDASLVFSVRKNESGEIYEWFKKQAEIHIKYLNTI